MTLKINEVHKKNLFKSGNNFYSKINITMHQYSFGIIIQTQVKHVGA